MKTFKQFLNENSSTDIINDIKRSLIDEYDLEHEFNGNLDLAWKNFVDNQELGDCQSIVASIIRDFPIAKKVFGEIEIDDYYTDEYGDEQNLMTHHWITINNEILDFSKGTLKDYINWDDLYDVTTEDWRYNLISAGKNL